LSHGNHAHLLARHHHLYVTQQADSAAPATASIQVLQHRSYSLLRLTLDLARRWLLLLAVTTGIGQQAVSGGSAVLPSVGTALSWLQSAAAARPELQLQVLVTGSLYLVGDCLVGLQQQPQ
jgi:hypothetical protein